MRLGGKSSRFVRKVKREGDAAELFRFSPHPQYHPVSDAESLCFVVPFSISDSRRVHSLLLPLQELDFPDGAVRAYSETRKKIKPSVALSSARLLIGTKNRRLWEAADGSTVLAQPHCSVLLG
ncbi:Hypothetical protein NTJ_00464 [Nesidiocoris tenuis]|uniref:Uncharacterized protein n=1 Tax=Nesidiocoris tenuis TaxID=355587 RepID=A0ABN7A943_9HEMI|nr:Hypothetical protein NTJ_00464 [Nesidiocoris tenuis]